MKLNINKIDLLDDYIENKSTENEEISKGFSNDRENYYVYKLAEILDIDMKDFDTRYTDFMYKNYPHKTKREILDTLEKQKDYNIRFHHQHEGVSEKIIKKYLLLDEYDSDIMEITLETPELHDCNLVELNPELQKKAYRGYRGDRNVLSHLINREDYPKENKTNKLTVVGKRECDTYDDEPYFLIITAFWGDRSAEGEPRGRHYERNEYIEMEYRMNHALIPENGELITKDEAPDWVSEYRVAKNIHK